MTDIENYDDYRLYTSFIIPVISKNFLSLIWEFGIVISSILQLDL
ncbi:MAG: hypothetical protein Pg6B_03460 [Candidatus Azobacteroides pseudotrichonymphae]|nr:MAG: hypothetical protein Pg6B_03460 [Candidatus Azobacteroides pseudotrichonymphae]